MYGDARHAAQDRWILGGFVVAFFGAIGLGIAKLSNAWPFENLPKTLPPLPTKPPPDPPVESGGVPKDGEINHYAVYYMAFIWNGKVWIHLINTWTHEPGKGPMPPEISGACKDGKITCWFLFTGGKWITNVCNWKGVA